MGFEKQLACMCQSCMSVISSIAANICNSRSVCMGWLCVSSAYQKSPQFNVEDFKKYLALLYISFLYITIIVGIREKTLVLNAVDILFHWRIVQGQAKTRSQERVILGL